MDPKIYLKKYANESDANIIVGEDTLIIDKGKPAIAVIGISDSFNGDLIWGELNKIRFIEHYRTSGTITQNKTIGYGQRVAIRNDYCMRCVMHRDHPSVADNIESLSNPLQQLYKEHFPEVFQYHKEWVDKNILDEYRMKGTIFTQGIINKQNRLVYHKDNGNIPGTNSAMIVFNRYTDGGNLIIPEYDLKIKCRNNVVVIFCGENLIHGVTQIKQNMPFGCRYSIVFYSLKAMKNCLGQKEELTRIQQVKTQRAINRAKT